MKRTFVEFAVVTRLFREAGVSDDDLRDVQRRMMAGKGVIVQGTGGLRKIRCAAGGRGKSGGVRVVFADYPEYGLCLLITAFAKNVQANLSRSQKNEFAKLKARLDQQIRSKPKEPKP